MGISGLIKSLKFSSGYGFFGAGSSFCHRFVVKMAFTLWSGQDKFWFSISHHDLRLLAGKAAWLGFLR
jgi:hypothetical protein